VLISNRFNPLKTDRCRYYEILAVLLTGALKFILMGLLDYRAFYICLITLFWIIHVYRRYRSDHAILKTWGFQKDNFRQSILFLLPFVLFITAGIIVYGFLNHKTIPYGHLVPVLVLYPVWGLVQQFMVVGLLAGNLKSQGKIPLKNYQVILITSVLFSMVHYPSGFLMVFTFLMELVFIISYLKWRNLWSLGLYHGVLGGLLLFYVLGRDPWLELWPLF
jgi:hypothetical protein